MSRSRGLIGGVVAVAVALFAALAFERVYHVSFRVRPPDPLSVTVDEAVDTAKEPLALRLVDSGGAGIPLDPWGADYKHDRRVFHRTILEAPPYIDAAEFARVEGEWRLYVDRMLEYGNNAVAVPLLLELIDFNRVGGADGAFAVYPAESEFRARHATIRRHFGPLFEWTAQRGMQVFLDADMLSLTPPLADYLRAAAPGRGPSGVDTSDAAVWDVYRAGLEELFDAMPWITGLIIRVGEGGDLYNTSGWPYRSEPAARSKEAVGAMLRGLLPAFESTGRLLVLRSWTVGVGPLGRLHVDPRVYDSVLGDIESPALIVSTKFTAGDFFSYLPLNPTLAAGRHRRLIEFQARPEFEGFAAFPDFLGETYARALRVLRAHNPRISGTYVLTQFGGPLRAGPRSLYPLHGFWLWSDANVFVASRLAADPGADVTAVTRQWAARTFGDDTRIVDAVVRTLTETRAAVLQGFYIRPFAEHEVRVPGMELPPLMWIFEWDMVGGWHSLLSIVYLGCRDNLDAAIEDGYAAAAAVRGARNQLQAVFAVTSPGVCAACDGALRSLEYQETLFDVLAAWRHAFLSYYHWLDTGSMRAWQMWREGRVRFDVAARQHVTRFGHDLDFPAFDLSSATRFVNMAERGALVRSAAATLLVAVILFAALRPAVGRLMWTTATAPCRLARVSVDLYAALAMTAISLTIVGFIAAALTGFAAPAMGAAAAILLGVVALVFEGAATGLAAGRHRGRLAVSAFGSIMPGALLLLMALAYLGPLGVWYSFWTLPAFRVGLIGVVGATALWTMFVLLSVEAGDGWRGRMAGTLAAAGTGLVAVAILLPDWAVALRALDRTLNFAPATETMRFALHTYLGVSLNVGGPLSVVGLALLVAGLFLSLWRPRSTARRSAFAST